MKRFLSLFILVFSLVPLLCSCNYTEKNDGIISATEAPVISDTDTEGNDEIFEVIKRFISDMFMSPIDSDSFEIVNTAELYRIQDGEFYGYLIDIKDADGGTAYLVIDAETNKVNEFAGGRSIFLKKIALGEVEPDAKLYYSTLSLWVVNGENLVNLIGGEVIPIP